VREEQLRFAPRVAHLPSMTGRAARRSPASSPALSGLIELPPAAPETAISEMPFM
jgi:hypothetical protein